MKIERVEIGDIQKHGRVARGVVGLVTALIAAGVGCGVVVESAPVNAGTPGPANGCN
jgi:hypothetical protein